jgi:hypothetical protein
VSFNNSAKNSASIPSSLHPPVPTTALSIMYDRKLIKTGKKEIERERTKDNKWGGER